MPTACCVCRRQSDVYYNLSFHRLPTADAKKKELWCSSMGLSSPKVSKYWRICGLHFTADSYKDPVLVGNKKLLKSDAVPTIIDISEEEITKNAESMIHDMNVEGSISSPENETQENQSEVDEATDTAKDNECIEIIEDPSCDSTMAEKMFSGYMDTGAYVNLKNIRTVNWEDVADSPIALKECFEKAKETIAVLDKKLNCERVRSSRLRKSVRSFRSLFKQLSGNFFLPKDAANKLKDWQERHEIQEAVDSFEHSDGKSVDDPPSTAHDR